MLISVSAMVDLRRVRFHARTALMTYTTGITCENGIAR